MARNQAILPAWGAEKTQQETPGLLLSSQSSLDFDQNPTQTTISHTYDSLCRLTDAFYSNGFEFNHTYTTADGARRRFVADIYGGDFSPQVNWCSR
jgi:hypothetical protein